MTTANICVLISHIMTKMGKEYIRRGKTCPETCLRRGETRYCLFISKAAIMLRYNKNVLISLGFVLPILGRNNKKEPKYEISKLIA